MARRLQFKRVMKTLAAIICLSAGAVMAATWNGKLVDSACMDREHQTNDACAANKSTTEFALQTANGKMTKLDTVGNAKAVEAVRDAAWKNGMVRVTGTTQDGKIKVERIEIQ
jgi:hypothetical protein